MIDTNLIYSAPRFNLDYSITPKKKISLNVYRSFDAGSPNELLIGGIVQNFRSIFSNNFILNISKGNSIGLDYLYKNAIKATSFSSSISYTKTNNNVILQSQINTDGSLTFFKIPFQNNFERLAANIAFQKYWFGLNTNFKPSVNLSINKLPQILNGDLIQNVNKNISVDFLMDSKINEQFNFSISTSQLLGKSKNLAEVDIASFINYFAKYKLNFAYVIKDKVILESITNYNFLSGQNQKNKFLLSDFKLTFNQNKNSPTYIFGVDNLFNNKTFTNQNLNVNSYYSESYFVRPRIFYCTIKFLL